MSAWMAAATSYSISDVPMLPFYIYYSMFGFQRVGDLCWAAGDMRARGFSSAARPAADNGEGLQHEDGPRIFGGAFELPCLRSDVLV
jgi:pyruvate dehydrogenase E1 component